MYVGNEKCMKDFGWKSSKKEFEATYRLETEVVSFCEHDNESQGNCLTS
jgi:hypothetical protein